MKGKAFDIGVSLAIIVAAGLVYWDARKYRPGIYDPLGSGTMPRMIAVAIVVLCLVAIVQTLLARRRAAPADAPAGDGFERRPWLALVIFACIVACSVLLFIRVPFGITSSLTLFACILAIKRYDREIMLPGAVCSVAFGFGLTYLFGNVFGVDLP
jgi:hypothetical protein